MSGPDSQDAATPTEIRVIVLPPTRADGLAMGKLFTLGEIGFLLVGSISELCREVHEGAGSVIVPEEALIADSAPLLRCVAAQQMWSDLPIIVLSRSRGESSALAQIIPHLGNVSVIERPVRTSTLLSLVRSSCRARQRQYQVRGYLHRQDLSQRAIREAERRYRALVDNVTDYAIFMTDPAGLVSSWNSGAQAVLGYADQEVLGRPITSFLTTSDDNIFEDMMAAAKRDGRATSADWQERKDGTRRYLETLLVAMRDEQGVALGVAYFLRDVTEKHCIEMEREELLRSERAARTEAERSSRIKDEFLATLSHELRTPLNAVLGWTQVARRTADLPDNVIAALATIERNARSQAQIIEDLLDMSSIISGKVRLQVQQIDLAPIINATVETVRPAAQAKGVRLQVALDPAAGPVRGDPSRLQQVLWNLMTNAVKFTPKEGSICVTLARAISHLEIEVTDTGEGIEPSFLPHVFDRFRQADASTTRRHGGLGLGLSIVKQLVELHGGSITATSAGQNKGATFRLSLPLMSTSVDPGESKESRKHRAQAVTAPPESGELQEVKLGGLTILVVDDEPDARSLVQRVLEDHEAHVITAASAEEAVATLIRERPDVLVSDIGMPREDGYSLIRRVRSLRDQVANIPAIALTAYARAEDRMEAIHAGYQLHLSKPVEPIELAAMIENVVRRSLIRR